MKLTASLFCSRAQTCEQARFDEIETKLTPFLKQCGYNTKKDVYFLPISGLHGYGARGRRTL